MSVSFVVSPFVKKKGPQIIQKQHQVQPKYTALAPGGEQGLLGGAGPGGSFTAPSSKISYGGCPLIIHAIFMNFPL